MRTKFILFIFFCCCVLGASAQSITGTLSVCTGSTTALGTSGIGIVGEWTSDDDAIASVDEISGVVTGNMEGTTTISYSDGTTSVAATIEVFEMTLQPITGGLGVCKPGAITLSDADAGGTWSSSDTHVGTINSSSGQVTAAAPGTTTISYTLDDVCYATAEVTVVSTPATITGTTLCNGTTTTFGSLPTGGTWSTSNSSISIDDVTAGIITGESVGTAHITYTLPGGCRQIAPVHIIASPPPITGDLNICAGNTNTLDDDGQSATWTSSDDGIASISGDSDVFGESAGTATITCTASNGCFLTVTVNVYDMSIGLDDVNICAGATTILTNSTPGGTWSSDDISIDEITGEVTGSTAGTAIISYNDPYGCGSATGTLFINALPAVISGTFAVHIGNTVTLTDATTGGSWSSGSTGVATVDGAGLVTGIAGGTVVITYTAATGCYSTAIVTVDYAFITGSRTVCLSTTNTLGITGTATGGTWSSSNTAVGTIDPSSGIVAGISTGTTLISYTNGSDYATAIVTVASGPDYISGPRAMCPGSTIGLTGVPAGGSWSGSNAYGSIDAAGIVTATYLGSSTVTITIAYELCGVTVPRDVEVNTIINGTDRICVDFSLATFNTHLEGGTWTVSGAASILSIFSNTSEEHSINNYLTIHGDSHGTGIITYTTPSCTLYATVYVGLDPNTGTPTTICVGSSTSLQLDNTGTHGSAGGGTWTSSDPTIATIQNSGFVTGISPGPVLMTYTHGHGGCQMVSTVIINQDVAPIGGTKTACIGSTTMLSDATPSGTWSSSNNAVGTINSSTGVLSGISAGTTMVSYTIAGGCVNWTEVTVNVLPSSITGTLHICMGATTALSSSPSGGTWSSSTPAVATVGSTGIVSGISTAGTGTATISYLSPGGCGPATAIVTVTAMPDNIAGLANVCTGTSITLTDAVSGGTWSSSTPSVATVGSTGIVSGVIAGTVTISYTLTGGCYATKQVDVLSTLPGIYGLTSTCIGASTALGNIIPGGTWSNTSMTVASVGSSTGIVSGIATGSNQITYSIGGTCTTTTNVTVTEGQPVTGTPEVCVGSTTALTGIPGNPFIGTWASSNDAVATVGTDGVVTGVMGGTVTITFTMGINCFNTIVVTVNELPDISGTTLVCEGSNTTLTGSPSGGSWASATPAIGTVDLASGEVTGISPGNADIVYTSPLGCDATTQVTVSPVPSTITGDLYACIGEGTHLSSTPGGGTWSTTSMAVSVGEATGIIQGSGTAGVTAVITYTFTGNCYTTTTVTTSPMPAAISGYTTPICRGDNITLADATAGGTWVSFNPAVATIGSSSGVVTGQSGGNAFISYTLPTGCYAGQFVQVTGISGGTEVCYNSSITLTTSEPGGTWSSSTPAVGTVSLTGVVTSTSAGTSVGTTTITYISPSGCTDYKVITVGAAFSITACEETPLATCDGLIAYSPGMQIKVSGAPVPSATTYTWADPISATSAAVSGGTLFTFTAAPINPPDQYTITANNYGCTATAHISIMVNGNCYPAEYFKPSLECIPGCTDCNEVPYFKTINAEVLDAGNLSNAPGNYYIAKDATLTIQPYPGSVFFMGQDVTLKISSYVKLDNVHFFSGACSWKGIQIMNDDPDHLGQVVIANNTLIENANMGGLFVYIGDDDESHIPASAGLIIDCSDGIFNQDQYGIFIKNYTISPSDPYPFSITKSVFTSRNFCAYQTGGSTPSASDCYPFKWPSVADLKTPTTTEDDGNDPGFYADAYPTVNMSYTSAGIGLHDVGYTDMSVDPDDPDYYGITIGIANDDPAYSNFFDAVVVGIWAANANLTCYNNIFRRMNRNNSMSGMGVVGINYFPGTKKNSMIFGVKNGATTYSGSNRFYNCWNSIYLAYYNQFNCFGSSMKGINYDNGTTSALTNNNGIYGVAMYSDYKIILNTFNNIYTPVYLSFTGLGTTTKMDVSYNIIRGLTSSIAYETGQTGILFQDYNLYYPTERSAKLDIYKNIIYGFRYGIKGEVPYTGMGTSTLSTNIYNNTVVIRDNGVPGEPRVGINCSHLSYLNTIEENVVYGDELNGVNYETPASNYLSTTSPMYVSGYTGIYLTNVSNIFNSDPSTFHRSIIQCNFVHDLPIGFEFFGDNELAWDNNVMVRNEFGMALAEDASLGVQGSSCDPSDNSWAENAYGPGTSGWPGWNDPSVYETFTFNMDPYPASSLVVRDDPNPGFPPYYFPANNGTYLAGTAYASGTSLVYTSCYGSEPSCAPTTGGGYVPKHSDTSNHAGDGTGQSGYNSTNNTTSSLNKIADHTAQQYTLMPNPSDGNINIKQGVMVNGLVQVRVTSMLGATVYSGELNFVNGQSSLDMDKVARGIYMLQLTDAGGATAKFKVVIEK